MTTFLFFDTETTGVKHRFMDIVSIAWVLTDAANTVLSRGYHLVCPENWIIPQEAIDIHKITNEMAKEHGKPLKDVMLLFLADASKADVLVAHNISYDKKVVDKALTKHLGHTELTWCNNKKLFCTYEALKDLFRVKGKGSKLGDIYNELFGAPPPDWLHNAAGDTEMLMQICFKVWGTPLDLPLTTVKETNETRQNSVSEKLVISLAETT